MLFHSKCIFRQKSISEKRLKNMFNGSNCDRKSQLSGVLTEPLNPRDVIWLVPLTECVCSKVNSAYRNMTLN